jgi:HPt (histidine-containing phosphotransfer) domain-containing protein
MLDQFDGDKAFCQEIIQLSLQTILESLSKLRKAYEKMDNGSIQFEAHTIKGILSNSFAMKLHFSLNWPQKIMIYLKYNHTFNN